MNTLENQNVLKWAKIVLIILAVFLAVQALAALKNLKSVNPAYNSISVNGTGEAVSIPDVASFSFSVSADAQVVSDAQENVTTKINTILDGLKGMGIDEKDIKTTNYSVYPKYDYPAIYCANGYCPQRSVQNGYTATHNITVKVKNTENAGKALALAGERGATDLSNISFTVDDPDQITEEARLDAIEDARNKAEMLADQLGVRLVRVVNFYDNSGVVPYYYAEAGMGGDMAVRNASAPEPKLPMGENQVTVNVTVVYEIR